MLDPRQDQALQDLARSIARSVDALGGTCTARLLGSIALGLVDSPGLDEPTKPTSPADTGSKPASRESARYSKRRHMRRKYGIRTDPRRRRNRP